MKTEAETGAIQLRAKEDLGPPEPEESKDGPPSGIWMKQKHQDFESLVFRTVRQQISTALSNPICTTFLWQH